MTPSSLKMMYLLVNSTVTGSSLSASRRENSASVRPGTTSENCASLFETAFFSLRSASR